MTNKDRKKFAESMSVLNEEYGDPSKPISDLKLNLYFKALSDLSIEDFEKAVWLIVNTRKTASFPKIPEIREAIIGDNQDKSIIAWEKLINAIRAIGGYRSVIFDDPAISAIVELQGGWEKVCNMTSEEMKWFGKDFIKMYPAFIKRDLPVKALSGIHEKDSALKGIASTSKPVMIGTTEPLKSIAIGEK